MGSKILRWLGANWPAMALFAGLIVVWQLAVSLLSIREYLLPSPMAVLRAAAADAGLEIALALVLLDAALEIQAHHADHVLDLKL